jgi:adenylate kinase
MPKKLAALLLIGPTGSGKTPLGKCIEDNGLTGRRCIHFDFGENLRRIKSLDDSTGFLTRDEIQTVLHSLVTGALLTEEEFPIARKILLTFIETHLISSHDVLILNGLPRHKGQSEKMDDLIDIQGVIHLQCTPETVFQRIKSDIGGDRGGRKDDTLIDIKNKLKIFQEKTEPLLHYFRSRQISVLTMPVYPETTAKELFKTLLKIYPDH